MDNKEKPIFTSPNVHEVHEIGKMGFADVRRQIALFLSLAELWSLTSLMQTVFLTFFGSWVTSEVSFFLEDCSVGFCICDAEGSCDAVTDCTCLACEAAALYVDKHVELVGCVCCNEWLVDNEFHCVKWEVFFKRTLVDDDVAIARDETDSCDCCFSSTCSEILDFLNFLCSHNSPQLVKFELDRALCLIVVLCTHINAELLEHFLTE